MRPRPIVALVAVLVVTATVGHARADVVPVRFPEAATHAFPALRSLGDDVLAYGELVQTVRGTRVESRLTFRFKDGSLFDETVVFSQAKVFSLGSYRLVQRGPSFGSATQVSFDRASGRYQAKQDAETAEGTLELPPDVHNGMTGLLLKNLAPGAVGRGHLVAFTPKPTLVKSELRPEGEDRFFVGDQARTARRYLVTLEIGGLTGVVASVIGKQPPELRYWISSGPAPAFLKFEGAMFLSGPPWRIVNGVPRWPK